jgi:hypothetical protein
VSWPSFLALIINAPIIQIATITDMTKLNEDRSLFGV